MFAAFKAVMLLVLCLKKINLIDSEATLFKRPFLTLLYI